MTLTLYATDREFQQVISFLNNVSILRMRTNVAFHVVFKDGVGIMLHILKLLFFEIVRHSIRHG